MKATYSLPIVKASLADKESPVFGTGIRLAIYQTTGQVGDETAIRHNLDTLQRCAAKAAGEYGAQLIVFSELFLCGYNIFPDDIPSVAMSLDDSRLQEVANVAKANNIAIVCPYAEKTEDTQRCFDSMVLYDRDGTMLRNYRKTQLWGNDEKSNWRYPYVDTPEEAYQVDRVNGINVGMLNCYEAEFPELYRILALKGAQLVVIPTAADVGTMNARGEWSDWAYPDVSKTALPVAAYQNKIFTAYSNHTLWETRSNGTLTGVYLGNSVIANPHGEVMVAADNVETLLVADCVPGQYTFTHPDGQSDYIRDRRPPLYGQLTAMTATMPDGSSYTYPEDPNKSPNPDKD